MNAYFAENENVSQVDFLHSLKNVLNKNTLFKITSVWHQIIPCPAKGTKKKWCMEIYDVDNTNITFKVNMPLFLVTSLFPTEKDVICPDRLTRMESATWIYKDYTVIAGKAASWVDYKIEPYSRL